MMKKYQKLFLFCFFAFLMAKSFATTYYVSSTDGNDSYSTSQAQNPSTPWQSISKANSFFFSLKPGDNILFKRGDVFYGSLIANASGTSGGRIVIGAYGSGTKPLFTGFINAQNWTNIGNGVWQYSVPTSANYLNLVKINGQNQAMGRFPNADAANGGYLSYESIGTNSITDNQLSGSPNWTGADVIIRKVHWILDRCKITGQSGGTINYINSPTNINTYPGLPTFGYFIQNDPRTLDKLGEWYFNPQTKVIRMYFGSDYPSNYLINISVFDNVLNLANSNYITVDNIGVEGSNENGIFSKDANDVTIQNCSVNNSGNYGIDVLNTANIDIENNTVTDILSDGIYVYNTFVGPTIIRNNSITNVGLLAGMGMSGDDTYQGLLVNGNNVTVEYNNVQNTGFIGINFQGNNIMIKNNYVNTFCSVKDDGGGIYTWAGDGSTTYTNRSIIGNIVLNAIGAKNGGDRSASEIEVDARGLYMDGASNNINIKGNSIANCIGSGMFFNNIVNVNTSENTIFNSYNCISLARFAGGPLLRSNNIYNNIFFPLRSNQTNIFYWNSELYVPSVTDIQSDMRTIANLDNNYYRNDLLAPFNFYYHTYQGGTFVAPSPLNLDQWKLFMNQDYNSKTTPAVPAYKINNSVSTNSVQNGQFTSGISSVSLWSANNNFSGSWDNSNQISGGSLKISPNASNTEFSTIYAPIGAVIAGKSYVLRVTTLGTSMNGFMRGSLKQSLSPYNSITPTQSDFFDPTAKTHEFLITPTVSESNASYLIEIQQNSGVTYLDNIEFYEVSASIVDPASQVRFEYNNTQSDKTVTLDANYVGTDKTKYSGSVTLAPYTSKILIRDNSTTQPLAPIPSSSLTTVALAPAIKCFGGSTSVTVNASGGTAPYKGAGTFSATAGAASLKLSATNPVSGNFTLAYSSIGAISSSKNYVLRFSTVGTTVSGSLRASLRKSGSPYTSLTGAQTHSFGTSRIDHQFIYTNPTDEGDGSFLIELDQASGTTYIDNIAVFEAAADGSLTGPNLFMSGNFENGLSPLIIWSLNNNHQAQLDNNSVINNINYYSVSDAVGSVRTTGVSINQPASALKVSVSYPPILVSGGGTTATVNATGGTPPYTGTGQYNIGVGTYTYTVVDAAGCSNAVPIVVTLQSTSSGNLAVSGTTNTIKCFGGSTNVTIDASGGTAPYSGAGTFNTFAGYGVLKLSATNPVSGNYTLAYYPIGDVSSSKNYVLRFSTLGTTNNGLVRASLRMTEAPFTSLTGAQTDVFGTSRIDHQFLFTNPNSIGDGSFLIELDQASGTTYIDNIAVFEAAPDGTLIGPNLYTPGNFENGISQIWIWSLNGNHLAQLDNNAVITNINYYTVSDAAGVIRTIGVNSTQPLTPLQAFSTAPPVPGIGGGTVITVTATGGTPPYIGTGPYNVGVGNYAYTVVDANGCTASTAITIGLSEARINTMTNSTAIASSLVDSKTLNITSYPNPSTNVFNVNIKGGTSEKVYISVMGYDGRLLYQAIGRRDNTFTFGTDFIPGFYTLTVKQGQVVKTFKLIKGKL
jgi:hypothetical protein